MLLEPGTYVVRFAVADSEGRMGSIERKVDVVADERDRADGRRSGGRAGVDRSEAPVAVPAIEPRVGNGRLAAMMEVYAPNMPSMSGLQATLDVAARPRDATPLTTSPMQVAAGDTPEVAVLQASAQYRGVASGTLSRARDRRAGGKAQGHIVRPFRVVGRERTAAATTASDGRRRCRPSCRGAMLADLPAVDRKELLAPGVMNAVLAADRAGASRRQRRARVGTRRQARSRRTRGAWPPAISRWPRSCAASTFSRKVRWIARCSSCRWPCNRRRRLRRRGFFLAPRWRDSNRYREAAGLLQSVTPDVAGSAPVARMAGLSWLHAGDASLAIQTLEKAEPRTARRRACWGWRMSSAIALADATPLLAEAPRNQSEGSGGLAGRRFMPRMRPIHPRPGSTRSRQTGRARRRGPRPMRHCKALIRARSTPGLPTCRVPNDDTSHANMHESSPP